MSFIKNNLLLFFILLSVGLRLHSFFPSVLNQDESTYLIIAQNIVNGAHLYVDVTDTKPVGIFLIYSLLQVLLGNSILFKRLVVAIIIGLTAYIVSKVSRRIFNDKNSSIASGVIYILFTSVWMFYGLSPNTELFYNSFTIGGLAIFLNRKWWQYFVSGFLFGIGFIIKYVVLFDFVFLISFFMVLELIQINWKFNSQFILRYLSCGLAFLFPFLMVNAYFFFGDHFDSFFYVTYSLPGKYMNDSNGTRVFGTLGDFVGRFAPISTLWIYILFSKQRILSDWRRYFFYIWIFSSMLAIFLQGKGFLHYMLQLVLPLSILSGLMFHPNINKNRVYQLIFGSKVGKAVILGLMLAIFITGIWEIHHKKDVPKEICYYLKEQINKGDLIYSTHVYYNIVYYLLEKESPSVYVHNTPNLLNAFNIDPEFESMKILKLNPRYVITRETYPRVEDYLCKYYCLEKTFGDSNTKVYQYKAELVEHANESQQEILQ